MNKPSVVSFLITLLLAAAVCTQAGEPVKVTVETDLKTDQQYYIQPVNTNVPGGGLVPAPPTLGSLCPLGIVQTAITFIPGVPVTFSFPNPTTKTTISTDDYVNIEFKSKFWLCDQLSKFWKVDESSSATEEPSILVGGTKQEQNSWFKIEKAGTNTYKLTSFSGPIGTKPGGFGVPQLVLTNDKAKTLLVKFKKVDEATITTSTSLRMFPF
ncbi:PREDICTED: cysteine protease inhibitor WSCP-like [Camelina sativa]|uniref:Cysteine protease inhibitor WSCP-like n=1 Tax=Camelina sativa TaxID=90675 RepID=A0ABM0STM9_CAMSA|nr:PREDICTED: cysteine protease inhibitor WSCP-like [Camelina sativa]XP_010415962.1 PREDICTED: cysteine protease inhibitor WSCP-like [Camelina sativa]XP_010415965.1 PREDICTED: cysteine protease inhibitor WSCP-like [Camelina sativa]XP_010415966.1 PREDICTED: cysteine protease inhibitor WSCP-like [Camelina sativa]